MKELGSEVARQPEGEVARQAKSSQPTQPNPNPNHDRTGRPVVCSQYASQTRFSRDCKNVILEVEANHDRTVRPVVCSQSERSMLNEMDIDFRISGLPHSVVKQAENSRVRELVKKIENRPHRHALQRDLQQNEAYNPFSTMTKQMIKDVGNVELFELCETNPQTQCKECVLFVLESRHRLLHLRASLERKWSQPRRHSMYIGPSFYSKLWVKLYSPREESFPIPQKYIDVSRTTQTNLDVKQEKPIDDYWNRWIKRFVRSLDSFHSIYSIGRKTSRSEMFLVVLGETDKTAGDIQVRLFMARTLDEIGKKC